MISQETTLEFKKVIEQEFGVVLDESEASEILLNWVGYFDLLAKIDHRNNQSVGGRIVSPLKKTD